MFPGLGTVINAAAILAGSSVGLLVGHRLPERTRELVTDALGLVTLLLAAQAAMAVADPALSDAVGDDLPVLIVLGGLLIGGIVGSLVHIESRLEDFGGWMQARLAGATAQESSAASAERERFIGGFVTASLVFCVGPLTILGSISDGLGNGIDQLATKAMLDGFAAIAFAATFGIGVMASALTVLVVQGLLTAVGFGLGSFVPDASLAAMTATGGLILVGVALRLLNLKAVAVGDLLPALVAAPLLVQLVTTFR